MPKKNKTNNHDQNNNGHDNGDILTLCRTFKPKTINQASYVRAIVESHIILCTGPPGSGKTACAVGLAVEHLRDQKVKKIIITRPVVESGRGLGYLPGDFKEKIHPYMIPIFDELSTYIEPWKLQKLIQSNIIEIAPLEYMRGRNFHHAYMLLDEAQNANIKQLKMFITRIGKDSKCIINGDLTQSDLDDIDMGLKICTERLTNIDYVSIMELTYTDIIRHSIIEQVLSKLP